MVFGSMATTMDRSRKISRMSVVLVGGTTEAGPSRKITRQHLCDTLSADRPTAEPVSRLLDGTGQNAAAQALMEGLQQRRPSAMLIDPLASDQQETKMKQYLRVVGPHVGLVVLCIFYTFAGATLFYLIERPHEDNMRNQGKQEVIAIRRLVIDKLWDVVQRRDKVLRVDWDRHVNEHLDNVTNVLLRWFPRHYIGHQHYNDNGTRQPPHMWTYPSALFFSASTITTIGYGNLVPDTAEGRIVCVIFGLFGIPLMLVTIADIGKFIGDGILYLYARYSWYKQRCRRAIRRRRGQEEESTAADDDTSGADDDEEHIDDLMYANSVPVTWILLIIVGYTALGGVFLPLYEDWSFQESFYFSFITMSTIGFGDFVPKKQDYFGVTLVYILMGLAITTMCVDLVGSQYIQKMHYVGRQMKNAREALRTVGDLVRYTAFLRKRYGFSDEDLDQLTLERLCLGPHAAFTPHDINRIYFIDQRTVTETSLADRAAGLLTTRNSPAASPSPLLTHLQHIDTPDDDHQPS